MAPENDAPTTEESPVEPAPKKGGLKTLLIVGGLMLGEGVGLFLTMSWLMSPPQEVVAAEDEAALNDPLKLAAELELELCQVDAFNRREGRLYSYHMELSVLVDAANVTVTENFIKVRAVSIKDRIQEVIRSAEPADLNDPSLEGIKRQIRDEINNLLGKQEMIKQVLIGRWLQSRTNL